MAISPFSFADTQAMIEHDYRRYCSPQQLQSNSDRLLRYDVAITIEGAARIRWTSERGAGEFFISEEAYSSIPSGSIERYIRSLIREHIEQLGQMCIRSGNPYLERCAWHFENNSCLSYNNRPPSPKAEQKAKELLLRFLAPHQRSDYLRIHSFDLTVPKYFGQYAGTYRLYRERVYNIHHLESDTKFCAAPAEHAGKLPLDDILLAQKLMLETDPEGLLSKANKRDQGINPFYAAISSPLSITTGQAYAGYGLINNTLT